MKNRNVILKFSFIGTIGLYLLFALIATIGHWFDYGLSSYNETYSKFALIFGDIITICITFGLFVGIAVAVLLGKNKIATILMSLYFVYYVFMSVFQLGNNFNSFIDYCGLSSKYSGEFASLAVCYLFQFFGHILIGGTLLLFVLERILQRNFKFYPFIAFCAGVGFMFVGDFVYWVYALSNNAKWYACLSGFGSFLFSAALILGWICYFLIKKEVTPIENQENVQEENPEVASAETSTEE